MAISVQCPSCSKKLRINSVTAGKRVKCPGCGESFAPAQKSAATRGESVTLWSDRLVAWMAIGGSSLALVVLLAVYLRKLILYFTGQLSSVELFDRLIRRDGLFRTLIIATVVVGVPLCIVWIITGVLLLRRWSYARPLAILLLAVGVFLHLMNGFVLLLVFFVTTPAGPHGTPWTRPGAQLLFFAMSFAGPLVGLVITGVLLGLMLFIRDSSVVAKSPDLAKPPTAGPLEAP